MKNTQKAKAREKVWLRLDPELIERARMTAQADYADEKKWREIVEDAMTEYFAKRVAETDLSSLLSKTEHALFDRLYGKIEREFEDMAKRITSRVGGLVAVSSYDTALTAIMTEELYKEQHGSRYADARKLATERMKKRWDREGAGEIQAMVAEKKQAEEEARQLRKEAEATKEEMERYHKLLKRYKDVIEELQVEKSQTTASMNELEAVIYWSKGLLEQLENASMLTTAKSALEAYLKKNARPRALS